MVFYILLAIVIWFSCSAIRSDDEPKRRKKQALIGGITILLLSSCRSVYTGSDSLGYYRTFQRVAHLSRKDLFSVNLSMENGFRVFLKIISYISVSEHWLFFVTSFISIIPIIIFVYKYSKNIGLSWAIYILSNEMIFEMCTIRQSMAMGLSLLSLMYCIEHEKNKKTLIISLSVLLIAFSIHRSSIVFSIIVLITYYIRDFNLKHYLIAIISVVVIIFGMSRFRNYLYINQILGQKYYDQFSTGSGIARLLIPLSILFAFLVFRRNIYNDDKNATTWEASIIVSLLISISSFWVYIFSRTNLYYQLLYISSVPSIVSSSRIQNNKLIINSLVFAGFLLFFILSYDKNNFYDYILWNGVP